MEWNEAWEGYVRPEDHRAETGPYHAPYRNGGQPMGTLCVSLETLRDAGMGCGNYTLHGAHGALTEALAGVVSGAWEWRTRTRELGAGASDADGPDPRCAECGGGDCRKCGRGVK